MSNIITPAEEAIMDKISELWNDYLKLPERNHDDQDTYFREGIHRLQSVIAVRLARRINWGNYETKNIT